MSDYDKHDEACEEAVFEATAYDDVDDEVRKDIKKAFAASMLEDPGKAIVFIYKQITQTEDPEDFTDVTIQEMIQEITVYLVDELEFDTAEDEITDWYDNLSGHERCKLTGDDYDALTEKI